MRESTTRREVFYANFQFFEHVFKRSSWKATCVSSRKPCWLKCSFRAKLKSIRPIIQSTFQILQPQNQKSIFIINFVLKEHRILQSQEVICAINFLQVISKLHTCKKCAFKGPSKTS